MPLKILLSVSSKPRLPLNTRLGNGTLNYADLAEALCSKAEKFNEETIHYCQRMLKPKMENIGNIAPCEKKELKVGSEIIQLISTDSDQSRFSVYINKEHRGYIEKYNEGYRKVEGYGYHELIFARICYFLEN